MAQAEDGLVTTPAAVCADQDLADRCKALYRTITGGVSVITAIGDAGPVGMTASSLLAVSLNPPLLLVSLAHSSTTLLALRHSQRFAVNLLTACQQDVAGQFAFSQPGWARFRGVDVVGHDPPVLRSVLSAAVCTLVWAKQAGDHTLVLGAVESASVSSGIPLVWHASCYHGLKLMRPDRARSE